MKTPGDAGRETAVGTEPERREHMKEPEIGDSVVFVPRAFVDHRDPMQPDHIHAKIIYINRAHRYYVAAGPCGRGSIIREAFKF